MLIYGTCKKEVKFAESGKRFLGFNSGKEIVEIAAHIAAGLFDGVYGTVLMTMGKLKLNIGVQDFR